MIETKTGRGGARLGAGRKRALTVEQVRQARLARGLPPAGRPSLADLATRLQVAKSTVRAAVRGLPPYDAPEYHRAARPRPRGETVAMSAPVPPAPAPSAQAAPTEGAVVVSTPWRTIRGTRGRWARS